MTDIKTTILSHFGRRFDVLLRLELALTMQFTPHVVPQGQGIIQMTIKEYNIIFSDSFKFFKQKLETLPKRFQLEEIKGFFPHISNVPENWGVLRQELSPQYLH